jgi:hypothetical protein
MPGPASDIDAALIGDGPIRGEQVSSWIDAVEDSDLRTLSPSSIGSLVTATIGFNRNSGWGRRVVSFNAICLAAFGMA